MKIIRKSLSADGFNGAGFNQTRAIALMCLALMAMGVGCLGTSAGPKTSPPGPAIAAAAAPPATQNSKVALWPIALR